MLHWLIFNTYVQIMEMLFCIGYSVDARAQTT